MADGVRNTIKATCILQTIVPPADPVFGGLDARIPGSPRAMIERFNSAVAEVAKENDLVVDAAFLASQVGLNAWNDARGWYKAKLPASLDATPTLCRYHLQIAWQLHAARLASAWCSTSITRFGAESSATMESTALRSVRTVPSAKRTSRCNASFWICAGVA
jgi:hypothetical protein